MSHKSTGEKPPTAERDTALPTPTPELLEQSRHRMRFVAMVLENKGGVGKSRIAEILIYTLSGGESVDRKVLIAESDSANRNMKMVGASEFLDLKVVEWTGQLEYIGERIAEGEYDHAVIDFGARDELPIREFLPEYARYLAEKGVRLVIVRPITLSTFVQNNAHSFVMSIKTHDMGGIAVRNLSQGRLLSLFSDWIAKKSRAAMLAKGVIEIDMEDAGPRWSDEAVGYGLSFSDVVFGRFGKIKNEEDRKDAIEVFKRPVQLFLARWLRKQAQTFGKALEGAARKA